MRARIASVLAGVAGIFLFACGGSEPPPKAPEPEPEAPKEEAAPPKLMATQELGSIDERATNKTFESIQQQLLDCQKEGIKRVEFLAGDVRFFLRIAQDGSVRWAYLEDSTLGDRDTEKCMLSVVSSARWPKPEGGEAEVQKSMGFDPADARPPTSWLSDKIATVLAKQADDAMKCKARVRGVFKVTAYVEPDDGAPKRGKKRGKHEKEGRVLAVGVAPPSKDGEDKADCIADAVKEWHMPSPGTYAAKVTFNL